jgi:hypothetical protein
METNNEGHGLYTQLMEWYFRSRNFAEGDEMQQQQQELGMKEQRQQTGAKQQSFNSAASAALNRH